ncbi:ABC transporter permease [Nocardioides terrisoli]|uniref:ABC transporter permease n=1 Tax=Nocardioides terrisoli TaxID=3388267 RepID=UPI00287B6463|nr:ABC transporter permease [Nocardioides marmorisolisilvae]
MERALQAVRPYWPQIILLVALWVGLGSTTELFRGTSGVYSVLLNFSLLGLVAVGAAVTMIAAELDVSVAASAAVGGALTVRLVNLGTGVLVAIIAATATMALFGCMQGLLIARLRINSLVVTVGTLVLLGGVSFQLCGGQPLSVESLKDTAFLLDRWGPFLSPDIVAAIGVFIMLAFYLAFTRWGREVYAIGGAREEAIAAGVSLIRPITFAFGTSAGCAALAGSLASLKVGAITPNAYGTLLLGAISAALVGGISLVGGRGTVLHVAFGVVILGMVSSGLNAHGATDDVIQLFTGLILFAVVLLEYAAGRFATRAVQRRSSASALVRA